MFIHDDNTPTAGAIGILWRFWTIVANVAPLALMWIISFAPILFAEVGSLALPHTFYRIDRVNGGPVQMAILIASVLGVIVGSVTNRRRIVATA